jgi:hypothetical protein
MCLACEMDAFWFGAWEEAKAPGQAADGSPAPGAASPLAEADSSSLPSGEATNIPAGGVKGLWEEAAKASPQDSTNFRCEEPRSE